MEGVEEEMKVEEEEVEEVEMDEGEGEGDKEDGEEGNGEGDKEDSKSSSDNFKPFILPKIWSVNNFPPKMSKKVFKKFHVHFQIPSHIPLRLLGKNKKCYWGRMGDVGFYEFVFIVGLRLPFTGLQRWLTNYLGVFVSQIYPNT